MARKDWLDLTQPERTALVNALFKLKAKTDSSRNYDFFVRQHVNFFSSFQAHRAASFFPWHREMLRRFEIELGVELPYWNWGRDRQGSVTTSATTGIFARDFLGHPDFLNAQRWRCVEAFDLGEQLRRGWFGQLPTATQVANTMAAPTFTQFTTTVERAPFHNNVHGIIGGQDGTGHMGDGSSPNDPVFFLHHCFVDKLWSDWQAKHPSQTTQDGQYWPLGRGTSRDLGIDAVMQPWGVSVRSTLTFRPY